ncbi:MAG TPA: hypothetical protein VL598_15775, partial [Trinickia sp.]|uniref:hypothetical protein n=1 Tax=Trinickia sp. TaxID=2571163 RepID=UPI002C6AB522
MEPPHENESFERYVSQRLSSFLCGQLVTLLLGYIVLIAGDIWLKRDMRGLVALASTLPTIPMALAAVVAWSARGRLCASLATLLFIGVLEAGVVQYALLHSGEPGAALAAFVVIPLAFSPVLLRGWDFPAAAVLAAAGPIAVVALRASPALEAFGVAISMFTAISTSLVTNVFAIALQRKHFRLEQQLRAFADSDELTQLPRRRRVLELGR